MSGGYDAASIVGQLGGLSTEAPAPPVTPDELIARFATSQQRREEQQLTIHRGFCGLTVIGSRDPMVSGFDDGYDFMGFLTERGWRHLPAKGDWPYVVYLRWGGDDDRHVLIEYCECDFTAWVCDTHEAAQTLYRGLRDA